MNPLPPQLLDAIDRRIDGLMSPAELAEFENELARSAELRKAYEEAASFQARIDSSLRGRFSAAALDLNAAKRPSPQQATRDASPRSLRLPKWVTLAAAAAIALVSVVTVYLVSTSGPGTLAATVRPTLAALYNSTVDSGFKPEEICTTRDKFADWLGTRFGVSLAPREERADITLVGWSYSTAISPYTGVLLATSDGQPIIVALDLKVRESGKGPPAVGELLAHGKTLHVHKAVINGLALYEVSTLDKPRIIDNLEQVPSSGN